MITHPNERHETFRLLCRLWKAYRNYSIRHFTQHRGFKCKKKERAVVSEVSDDSADHGITLFFAISRCCLTMLVYWYYAIVVRRTITTQCQIMINRSWRPWYYSIFFLFQGHNAGLLIRPSSHLCDSSLADDHNSTTQTPSLADGSPLQSSKRAHFSLPASPSGHMPSINEDDSDVSDLAVCNHPLPLPILIYCKHTGILVKWTTGFCVGHLPVSSTWYSKSFLGTHRFWRKW